MESVSGCLSSQRENVDSLQESETKLQLLPVALLPHRPCSEVITRGRGNRTQTLIRIRDSGEGEQLLLSRHITQGGEQWQALIHMRRHFHPHTGRFDWF